MKKIIAACGNDCSICPRHLPKSKEELRKTAELWYKIGYRDKIFSNDQISCSGCTKGNWCRYNIIQCTTEKKINNCGECSEYPCDKIKEAFKVTFTFEPECRKVCSTYEYEIMKKAFFEKEKNLNYIHNKK